MGTVREVETLGVGASANGVNGHKLVDLAPFIPEPERHVPLRDLPEGMRIMAEVTPKSLAERLEHIGARQTPAEGDIPERYSFNDGTHFEFGPQGPVFVMEGFGPYDRPHRFDLQDAAVRETVIKTSEKETPHLEFVFPFDELLQGHSGVTVITITPNLRNIQRVSAKDYASLSNREKEIVDVGRILHNQQNVRRHRAGRRHIR